MRSCNAVMLISSRHMREYDFREIAKRARALAPDVRAFTAIDGRRNRNAQLAQLMRPTLVVELAKVANYRHFRGHRISARWRSKLETLGILRDAGLPVPRFCELGPDTKLDPAEWGDYVVVKPAWGLRGAFVWIRRTAKLRYQPPESFPEDHPGRRGPLLAQRFIYTGRWPSSYRVLSFLGEPLHALRHEASHDQRPLESADDFPGGPGVSIIASTQRSSVALANEPDLRALARRIHAAIPDSPMLGIDLMREAGTGGLFIAEVNEHRCWTLSNDAGQALQRDCGLDFYAQWGALDLAAEALVRRTRECAR